MAGDMPSLSILEQYDAVLAKIGKAAATAQRDPGTVSVTAVTKTWPAEMFEPLLERGHIAFGENRVQEAAAKWPTLRSAYPNARLHLIGPLQSNKAAQAVSLFDVIETVDREKIAKAIATELREQRRDLDLFVQVNTGHESQKSGVAPKEAAEFVKWCQAELELPVIGLMAIPPVDEPPAPHFALLHKLGRQLDLERFSMGMSSDYETAVRLGATDVRLGSVLFGPRQTGTPG
jgi:pyridoxal phosphate enzyme (YggS family)